MATTGVNFANLFYERVDNTYSVYYDPTIQLPLLFKQGLVSAIQKKYQNRNDQRDYDDIRSLIKTNVVYSLTANQIYTTPLNVSNITNSTTTVTVTTSLPHNLTVGSTFTLSGALVIINVNGTWTVVTAPTPTTFTYTASIAPTGTYTANSATITYANMIIDYSHIFAVKAKFLELQEVTITGATNRSPIRLTLSSSSNNIRSTELITISGVGGNTAANGTFYAKKINSTTIDLYSDFNLTTKVVGTGNYTSGGTISRVWYEYCTPQFSERKIAGLSTPTIDDPKFEDADNFIKIYPLDQNCSEITIDYLKDTTIFIDPLDAVLDLELYYPINFLYYVVDVCADIFYINTKDFESVQKGQIDIKDSF